VLEALVLADSAVAETLDGEPRQISGAFGVTYKTHQRAAVGAHDAPGAHLHYD
jgi:hypothetical protein